MRSISPTIGMPSLPWQWPRKTCAELATSGDNDELQGSIQVMTVIWTLAGAVVLAGAVAAALVVRRRGAVDVLSLLVADVMGAEWAGRLGTDVQSVRGAVLHGSPAGLRGQLMALIASVAVSFEITAPSDVGVSVRCEYADGESVTVAAARISWDLVPAGVREQHLRTGEKLARCQWLVADPEPTPS